MTEILSNYDHFVEDEPYYDRDICIQKDNIMKGLYKIEENYEEPECPCKNCDPYINYYSDESSGYDFDNKIYKEIIDSKHRVRITDCNNYKEQFNNIDSNTMHVSFDALSSETFTYNHLKLIPFKENIISIELGHDGVIYGGEYESEEDNKKYFHPISKYHDISKSKFDNTFKMFPNLKFLTICGYYTQLSDDFIEYLNNNKLTLKEYCKTNLNINFKYIC